MTDLLTPVRLKRAHVREGFTSGADELDEWLVKYAWQNQRANNATTYVSVAATRVVGYYAITVAGVAREDSPESMRKGTPNQLGCLLLARLAVDESFQKQGLGRALLADFLRRAAHLALEVGIPAVLVHCRDETARSFYLKHAEFLASPVDAMQLMLPIKTIKASM